MSNYKRVTGGVLEIPPGYSEQQAVDFAHKFNDALRADRGLIAINNGARYTPLTRTRRRIRLAWTERGHR